MFLYVGGVSNFKTLQNIAYKLHFRSRARIARSRGRRARRRRARRQLEHTALTGARRFPENTEPARAARAAAGVPDLHPHAPHAPQKQVVFRVRETEHQDFDVEERSL